MVNYGIIKNEVLTNGGITLINNHKMEYKSGYIVSIEGYEFTTKDLKIAINKVIEYSKKYKCVGVWYDEGLYYIDVNKYFNKNERKKAFDEGIKNNQKAIYNIHENKSEYLKQNYYTIYKYNKILNDFININEFTSIEAVADFFNITKRGVQLATYTSIEKIKSMIKKYNNNYIIIKSYDDII